ncbi:aminomethyl-transferring glycine dehydrogenase subunit GcvPB [Synergistaceae bacterium OttesenSCG-928-I11]|nr:aminomethyl-transferring glycine dehydrogenase subunit GcvPB [Synergistaceae bacterium OttesenSCG-928-I11]
MGKRDFNKKYRNYHQARWDEPIIFELTQPGERGILLPEAEPEVEAAGLPELGAMVRKNAPKLPEMSQMRVLKHYMHLSQENIGADETVDIGQGTCTMKYNPKINDRMAGLPGFADIHPRQSESTVQGALELMYQTEQMLKSISGMDRFCMHPGGGAQAVLTIATVVRDWVDAQGLTDKKDEIITTIFSHPANPACAAVKGFKLITIYPDKNGRPDLEAMKAAVNERTAAVFITNPEDIGIYNSDIKEFTKLVHDAGGLCSYDQANANALLGITRAREADFDLCFFNIHKTFASPHGCGGPGCGVMGVREHLVKYLPAPLVGYDEKKDRYFLDYDSPSKTTRIKDFYGVLPAIVRGYSWMRNLGPDWLREVSRVAVLNNNYVFKKIMAMRGVGAPYAEGEFRMEQVRYSLQKLKEETGIGVAEFINRMFDYGMHLWSSHEPWIVPEPFTVEPTESYSKAELDEYLAVLEKVIDECYKTPDVVRHAPERAAIHHTDHDIQDDLKRAAITWRAYNKKYTGYFEPKA